ncbi:Gfo/Idh/MocA family oxidoreductase [Alicyclobacillus fastidiosus]|uniref:Gfo/Idh/MocA family oxidoreductase n=1 Tax=Alicyclobacillus fastidiosus TaxID=392011 RepID=A0ABY6ZFD4_9BACL|nr:Gfo/Idh/MocA family oxidoreductase [Alicyclobacillus fastidiosus]WAH41614.1 Gfo/Idh/MocA family oxidoreductase [Alicyclobacillus fastidiosus]GMA63279.1 4,5-dihydroxyphthalate dehydrogenase [Alicyclobacillus fastidiosus]
MTVKYCIVGTGSRGIGMFAKDLVSEYADVAQLVALCDANLGRLEYARAVLGQHIPIFTDFDQMMNAIECDTVIVTTKDATHHEFILKALQYGRDVITEKPMTIDDEKVRAILQAERETGKRVRVSFNYRYAPYKTKVKELLMQGIVGQVHSVEFRWYLDTVHGADYFRRWHRQKRNSGGLLVHKATHHFDLINWWLGEEPIDVFAVGSRQFYRSERKPGHSERCRTCELGHSCEFYLDVSEGEYRSLYLDHEAHDGYYRDQCVFSDDTDIEDTMSVLARYPNDIQLTYALTAATPFEGWQVAFNGSKGRLEAFEPEYFISEEDQSDFSLRRDEKVRTPVDWRFAKPWQKESLTSHEIRFYPLFGGVQTFEVPLGQGGHGGGDRLLKDHLFRDATTDPLGHQAGSRAGAMSVLLGVAANRSIAERRMVSISELLD